MKKSFLSLLCFYLSVSTLFAGVEIDSIDVSHNQEPHLVFLNDGRVVFVPREDPELIKAFQRGYKKNLKLDIKLNKEQEVLGVQTKETALLPRRLFFHRSSSYNPTLMQNLEQAYHWYERMRQDYQNKAQCYNMAHVWAYEEYQRSGLNSMKLFLFFSKRYIRRYRFHWWFHVTPMVYVREKFSSQRIVLDRRYTTLPLDIKTWTDHFIESRADCKEVRTYADYLNNQDQEDCFLLPVSMYYWQPKDIRHRDRTQSEKTEFLKSEIQHSYREAFKRR